MLAAIRLARKLLLELIAVIDPHGLFY